MLLGLDLGTSSIKALLVEPGGRIVASGTAPVKFSYVDPRGVEQDIDDIWSATLASIVQIGKSHDLSTVKAVGVSSQGAAMQVLTADYRPACPVISWLDARGRPWDDKVTAELGGDWFASHGGHGKSIMAVGQVLRLREQAPQLVAAPNRIGFVGDTIVRRLCGRGAHDATSLSICMLYNPALGTADPDILKRIGIDESRLPDLIGPKETAGPLAADVAKHTGLPVGIPVSAAVHDQYAAALGCGAINAGDVMFGAGTAWVLVAMVDRFLGPVIPSAVVCNHVVAGLYGQLLSMVNGGSSFSWAKALMGLASASGSQIEQMIRQAPPGCDGLRFWPLLAAHAAHGVREGTPGRLDGLQFAHTQSHVLRSVVEGLALELERHLRMLSVGGVKAQRLIMCGGAAASEVTPQVIADATGLEVACTTHSDISALGGAILARGLIEPKLSLAELSRQMAPKTRTVKPGPNRGLYKRLAEEYIASLPVKNNAKEK